MQLSLTKEKFIHTTDSYNMIPVYYTSLPDLDTPVSVYLKTHGFERPYSFLLESVAGGENRARYSIIGLDYHCVISGKKGKYYRKDKNKDAYLLNSKKPVEAVKEGVQSFKLYEDENLSGFYSGAVGFFSYEIIEYYEKVNLRKRNDDVNMDDIIFVVPSHMILFDHVLGQILIIENIYVQEKVNKNILYENALKNIKKTILMIKSTAGIEKFDLNHRLNNEDSLPFSEWMSNTDDQEFFSMVNKAKDYIREGDIFQVVLSKRFSIPFHHDPFYLYRFLRSTNPSPYMYFLNYMDHVVIGSSPEILVKVRDRKVTVRPIAGTIHRGKNAEEDEFLAQTLLKDEKEKAEHLMLVDLGRNDVGRIANYSSVEVSDFMTIEKYSHVMHIVSNVHGVLRDDLDSFDALLTSFPAGTVSGAPKIRAMQIINELEKEPRGIYSGGVGYFHFNGDMDMAIILRTMFLKDAYLYIQAGAGIVYDSIPEKENQEIEKKAKALFTSYQKFLEREKYDIYSR